MKNLYMIILKNVKIYNKGDKIVTKINRSNNIFEFTVSKDDFNSIVKKLEKPGLTKEYLDECKRVANLYKKPSKK